MNEEIQRGTFMDAASRAAYELHKDLPEETKPAPKITEAVAPEAVAPMERAAAVARPAEPASLEEGLGRLAEMSRVVSAARAEALKKAGETPDQGSARKAA